MSLGTHTKCDLSAGLAKLDVAALIKQVEIHYFSTVEKMRNKMSELQMDIIHNRSNSLSSMSSTGSKQVQEWAQQIAETTEILHTLYESVDRKIEIIR
jgi:hypothetical protein